MKKKMIFFLLLLMILFAGCSGSGSENPTVQTDPDTGLPRNWEPVLQIERYSRTDAVVVLHTDEQADWLILYGNDYTLEVFTESGWQLLTPSQEAVYWIKDAFVASAVPRDDIDWQWLYGALDNGTYRLGKPVTLCKGEDKLASSVIYAEFTLDGTTK